MKIVIDIHDAASPAEAVARLDRATYDADISYDVIGVALETSIALPGMAKAMVVAPLDK